MSAEVPGGRRAYAPLALFLGLALLYACSAPHTVALEDDGLFLLAAHFNGVAHPPGYPLWTLLAQLAVAAPFGSEAWRLHFLSGVFGALACVALWQAARELKLSGRAAWLAAACYGVSRVFWSQAIIAEVYTLNALILFTLLALLLRWRRAPSLRGAALLGLLYGLGLANHWPLLILETPALLLFLWPVRVQAVRALPVVVLALLVGLAPYAWMVLRSQQEPAISYYGPIQSWRDFWYVLSRAGYAGADTSATAGWHDRLQYLGFLAREFAVQFGPPGAVLLAAGVWLRGSARDRSSDDLAILLGVAGPTLVLLLLLGFDYDPFHQLAFRVYPLTAYGFAALWLGHGVDAALKTASAQHSRAGRALVAAVVIAAPLMLGATENLRGRYDFAEHYARALLSVPEPDAILFVHGDAVAAPAAYLHLALGERPDLELYSSWGLVFGNRLFRADRDTLETREARVRAFIAAATRPVYYATSVPVGFASQQLGLVRKVDRAQGAGFERLGYSKPSFVFYDWLLAQPPPADTATAFFRRLLLSDMGLYLLRLDDTLLQPQFRQWREHALEVARSCLQGNLAQAELMLALHGREAAPEVLRMMDIADTQMGDAMLKKDYAEPDRLRAAARKALADPVR